MIDCLLPKEGNDVMIRRDECGTTSRPGPGEGSTGTLGDLLYADKAKTPVSEKDWVGARPVHRRGRSARAACAVRTDASHRVHLDHANHQQSRNRRRADARRVSRRLATSVDVRCRGRNRRRMDHESGAVQSDRPVAVRAAEEARQPRSGRSTSGDGRRATPTRLSTSGAGPPSCEMP